MTIVRVLFPGLWETSWPKYVWFLEMNVYYFKLSTLFIKSTASFKAQLLLCWAWLWGTEGCGVGKETAGISNYYLKHQINIWWLLWDPFLWAMSQWGRGGGVHVPVTVWKLRVFNFSLHVRWRRPWPCYWHSNFFYPFPHFSPPKPLTYVPLPSGVFSASKNCISACRLGKQLSHFAHLRPLFTGFN